MDVTTEAMEAEELALKTINNTLGMLVVCLNAAVKERLMETMALVELEDDPDAESDLSYYRSFFGLPPCTTESGCFRRVDQNGGTDYPPVEEHENASEVSLDMDAVSALCPNCHVLVVEVGESPAGSQHHFRQLGKADP